MNSKGNEKEKGDRKIDEEEKDEIQLKAKDTKKTR